MFRSARDLWVRVNYAAYRKPLVWGVIMTTLSALVLTLLTRSFLYGVVYPVAFGAGATVYRPTRSGKERFARWAQSHPYARS
jgi:hypothetical protein